MVTLQQNKRYCFYANITTTGSCPAKPQTFIHCILPSNESLFGTE